MVRMGVYDQIKSAFQDLVAPAIHELRGQMRVLEERLTALDQKIDQRSVSLEQKIDNLDVRLTTRIDSLRAESMSMKNELVSEIRRVDTRIDGIDRELHLALDVRERLAALEARRPA